MSAIWVVLTATQSHNRTGGKSLPFCCVLDGIAGDDAHRVADTKSGALSVRWEL